MINLQCVQMIRCEERGFVQLLVQECQLSTSGRRIATGHEESRRFPAKLLDSYLETRRKDGRRVVPPTCLLTIRSPCLPVTVSDLSPSRHVALDGWFPCLFETERSPLGSLALSSMLLLLDDGTRSPLTLKSVATPGFGYCRL